MSEFVFFLVIGHYKKYAFFISQEGVQLLRFFSRAIEAGSCPLRKNRLFSSFICQKIYLAVFCKGGYSDLIYRGANSRGNYFLGFSIIN